MKAWNRLLKWFWLNLSLQMLLATKFLARLIVKYTCILQQSVLDYISSKVQGRAPPDIVVQEKILEFELNDDDCPEFLEIFVLPDGAVLGIQEIIRCPDETAIVRVLTDKDYSKPFKRKVFTEKGYSHMKYIKLDNVKYHIKKAIPPSS